MFFFRFVLLSCVLLYFPFITWFLMTCRFRKAWTWWGIWFESGRLRNELLIGFRDLSKKLSKPGLNHKILAQKKACLKSNRLRRTRRIIASLLTRVTCESACQQHHQLLGIGSHWSPGLHGYLWNPFYIRLSL